MRGPNGYRVRPGPRASRRGPCGQDNRPSRDRWRRRAGSGGRAGHRTRPARPRRSRAASAVASAKISSAQIETRKDGIAMVPTEKMPVDPVDPACSAGPPPNTPAARRAGRPSPFRWKISAMVKPMRSAMMAVTGRPENTSAAQIALQRVADIDQELHRHRFVEAHARRVLRDRLGRGAGAERKNGGVARDSCAASRTAAAGRAPPRPATGSGRFTR